MVGPLFLTQRAVRAMLDLRAAGTIERPMVINISSIYADTAWTTSPAYCLSKSAVGMLTRLLAAELAPKGVLVYEVKTGWIAEEMSNGEPNGPESGKPAGPPTLAGRWGHSEDVGRAVAALVQGDWAFSPGAVVPVDGGWGVRAS
jgi:NAD(P)-dependent dehydrogenase (short-subunit alcohol dehydrogenase family)